MAPKHYALLAGAAVTASGFALVISGVSAVSTGAGACDSNGAAIADAKFIQTAVDVYEWNYVRPRLHYPTGRTSSRKQNHPDRYRMWRLSLSDRSLQTVSRTSGVGWFWNSGYEIEVVLVVNPERRGDSLLPFAFDRCGQLLSHEFGYHNDVRGLTTANYGQVLGKLSEPGKR